MAPTAPASDPSLVLDLAYGVAVLLLIFLVAAARRARRHASSLRTGVVGALYELHNRDKQKALEVIVEDKAAARRPEYPDGKPPEA